MTPIGALFSRGTLEAECILLLRRKLCIENYDTNTRNRPLNKITLKQNIFFDYFAFLICEENIFRTNMFQ